jgi:dTDP-4-dehydrorhamnose reductase
MSLFPSIEQKRIAIVGSAGRLGGLLASSLDRNNSVIRLAREQMDIGDSKSIDAALKDLDYDFLIIAGALTAVDYCETHEAEAFSINAEGPGRIAEISAEKGAHVTFISTDFVYDGTKDMPYTEEDATEPISVYGASKLRGEKLVLGADPGNLVIRISWLYGPGKPAFPEWIINKACAETDLTLPEDKIGCPTSSVDLVNWMLPMLAGRDGESASGIFNLCNSRPCSWQEWGQYCIDTARDAGLPVRANRISGVSVDSVPAFIAKRPVNSSMSTAKYTARTGITPRDWQTAVREFLAGSDLFREHRPASATH